VALSASPFGLAHAQQGGVKLKLWNKCSTEGNMTRQRKWQLAQNDAGLCMYCSERLAAGSGYFCKGHAELVRTRLRNRYRVRHGIALDAPVVRGRPRQS